MKLCERKTLPSSHEGYTTLSHCWGGRDVLKLTLHTQTSFKQGIPLASLPLTFQDAVDVTRKLGLRYLWIDSLCILQDSVEDWHKESAMMDKIYTHARVNIAATCAEDSSKGLYRERDVAALNPPKIKLGKIGSTPKDYWIIDHAMWSTEIEDGPLNDRGWVIQERLLAARVLHFGKHQMVWECCEKASTEILCASTLPGRNHMAPTFKNLNSTLPLATNPQEGLQPSYPKAFWPYILWSQIVEIYSTAKLSYSTDKLVAISGIAKVFGKRTNTSYHAGMWAGCLEYQLLWHVADSVSAQRPSVYRAPTWSWASIDGAVCQPGVWFEHTIIAKVESVSIQPSFEDPYGMVGQGCLRISGFLRPILLLPNRTFIVDTLGLRKGPRMLPETDQYVFAPTDPEVRLDSASYDLQAGHFFCLPIYYSAPRHELRGLVLQAVEGQCYRRLGSFWSWSEPNIKAILYPSVDPVTPPASYHEWGKAQSTVMVV